MTRPETFIITGMHRSGTSLVARFLHLSGVDMGKEWIDPNQDNPLGYFEDADFVSLHQRILARNNPTRDQVMWIKNSPRIIEEDHARAAELVRARAGGGSSWGWKDPRTCFFLPFWAKHLPDASFLFVLRHPAAVLDSLTRRHHKWFPILGRLSSPAYAELWVAHNERILRFLERNPDRCTLVSIEDLVEDPDRFVSILNRMTTHAFSADDFARSLDPVLLSREAASIPSGGKFEKMIDLYAAMRRASRHPLPTR